MVNHKLVASIMTQLGTHGLPRSRSRRRYLVSIATSSDLVSLIATAVDANQLRVTNSVPYQRVGRISCSGKLGVEGAAVPRCTSRGLFQARTSCGRMVSYSIR